MSSLPPSPPPTSQVGSSRDIHRRGMQDYTGFVIDSSNRGSVNKNEDPYGIIQYANPKAPPIPINIPPRLQPGGSDDQQQPQEKQRQSPQSQQQQRQRQQQQHNSPFDNATKGNGAINPFSKLSAPTPHTLQNPLNINTTVSNPYDQSGPPGLATNFVDINCTCVKHIRSSKCDLPFQSFASCHNAVLTSTQKRNLPPMFFQCEGHYARMMMCIENAGLSSKLIEEPNVNNVFVKP